jgi:hypothetical protein
VKRSSRPSAVHAACPSRPALLVRR